MKLFAQRPTSFDHHGWLGIKRRLSYPSSWSNEEKQIKWMWYLILFPQTNKQTRKQNMNITIFSNTLEGMSKTLCIMRKHAHAKFYDSISKQCIRAMSKQLIGFKWGIQRKAFTAVYIGSPLLVKIVTESFLENCQKCPFIPILFWNQNKPQNMTAPYFWTIQNNWLDLHIKDYEEYAWSSH